MRLPSAGDIGLRVLALILAIVIYHALKTETVHYNDNDGRPLFHAN